ncbi:hypothetical protein H310_12991 [Aphanomyces invadans]|uniref:DDE Tnp4 domain-containing protein n=1 Tax=Aphanomyces invadans TaxID=157072 RepID=A0A024TGQ0_9STRA|nr:hypothetical protein H310_12991 [Aphanomyces invadans]ETV92761.1 hypothetical protein H310_12991 [Aphanomyces invadans]|eukprot:XP_008878531.1 hypothetical protein H310_12991 [Aphanomyces invadans]
MSFLDVVHPYLMRKYVDANAVKWTMQEMHAKGIRFETYAYGRYATDVTFQQTNIPVGSYAEKKLYYSGKHHLYGHKVEVSVLPNGMEINCTRHYKGSVADKTIFDENIEFHRTNLSKRPSEFDMSDETVPGERHSQWAVLADKGYQGIQRDVRAVIPTRKPAGGMLTFEQQATNDRIATDRVVVENFFGRMKSLRAVSSDIYRWSRKNYDIIFQTCVALTNVHLRFNPLRAEDGDVNVQYVNRLNAIGSKMIKDKKKAQATYREKRRTRLSMFLASESAFAADAHGSETELGSDSNDDFGGSYLF